MIVIPCKQPTYFDVDDTLVMWSATSEQLEKDGIDFECPGSLITIDEDGLEGFAPAWTERLLPHKKNIEQLKKHKMRGHTIIVWSQGGFDWCEAVVKALGLEQFVDLVISKPMWLYDDLPASEFMPKSQWMKDE